jgi:hypothetical protein
LHRHFFDINEVVNDYKSLNQLVTQEQLLGSVSVPFKCTYPVGQHQKQTKLAFTKVQYKYLIAG